MPLAPGFVGGGLILLIVPVIAFLKGETFHGVISTRNAFALI